MKIMGSKRVFIGIAAGISFLIFPGSVKAANGTQNITSTVNTARYILFGGSYNVNLNQKGDMKESAIFKLDTYTGKTWILRVETDHGKRVEKWISLEKAEEINVENPEPKDKENNVKTPLKTLKILGED